jgi:hypothetical protein
MSNANNPFPSSHQFALEAAVDELIVQQESGIRTFREGLLAFTTILDAVDWPLGCPVKGYDKEDLLGLLTEWANIEEPDAALAMEIAEAQS